MSDFDDVSEFENPKYFTIENFYSMVEQLVEETGHALDVTTLAFAAVTSAEECLENCNDALQHKVITKQEYDIYLLANRLGLFEVTSSSNSIDPVSVPPNKPYFCLANVYANEILIIFMKDKELSDCLDFSALA